MSKPCPPAAGGTITIRDLGEDGLIRGLRSHFSKGGARVIKAIGDDTSVTTQKEGLLCLATTDTLIEGTHFRRDYTTPELLGKKSLNISLSDIAAMGGVPVFYLVSLGLPPDTTKDFVDALYRGLARSAKPCGVPLAGGNTARMPGRLMVTTTVIGEVAPEELVLRSGASPGETIFVTGTIGDSALGLHALKQSGADSLKAGPYRTAVKRHLDPAPRCTAGRELARLGLATSMIDISDGLLLDLERLSEESRTGAMVYAARLPLSAALKRYRAVAGEKKALKLALTGGEDYELLFTSSSKNAASIEKLARKLRLRITAIGETQPIKAGVTVIGSDGRPISYPRAGYMHF